MSSTKLRVLVVEDSVTVRKRICEVLSEDPDIEVVGEAGDGQRGVELCQMLRPDVISMDMALPVMSGLDATEYIMAHCPTPILVVSSSWNRGELFKTYEALAAGAVDVLEKGSNSDEDGVWERRLVAALKMVSRIRVITHPKARLRQLGLSNGSPAPIEATNGAPGQPLRVFAIGASTGGPAAVTTVLDGLPHDLEIPILLVMHINEPFAAALSEWLAGRTRRTVRFAQNMDKIAAARGAVIMAPADYHLTVENGYFRLNQEPERHSCRPSVDVLFTSVAREFGSGAAACLLTGMGRDGAAGLLDIRRGGGMTIAQDEATSVVYGMPREAALLGAAEKILPLNDIAPALNGALLKRSARL